MKNINSEGFLAEVFHPWVRWEGPGSGFESSSGAGAGGGVWKSRNLPLGIEVEKHGFRTAWLMTGQKFQGVRLKLKVFILTFRDPSSHICGMSNNCMNG